MKIYQKITSEDEITPSIFYLITSHHPPCQLNRTWRLIVFGHRIYICTRCLGQYIGMALAIFATISLDFQVECIGSALLFFGILPFPAAFDWFTQTVWGRESVNSIRVLTGFLLGISLGTSIGAFLSRNWNYLAVALLICFSYMIIIMILLRRNRIITAYLDPYEQFIATTMNTESDLSAK